MDSRELVNPYHEFAITFGKDVGMRSESSEIFVLSTKFFFSDSLLFSNLRYIMYNPYG